MDPILLNPSGERLDGTFEPGVCGRRRNDWVVVLGHGVTGNKDRPVIADTAQALNAAGFDTLRFSFAGNGASGGDFRQATVSRGTEDLRAVIDAVSRHYEKICYLGHSMGAAVGVLQAARDPRIHRLVSLAGMVDTKNFAETEFGAVTPEEGCMWDDPACPLSAAYMRDLCTTVVDVLPQAAALRIPWLLVHGTADDVVLPRDTERIQGLRNGPTVKVVWIDGADHSFSAPEHKKQATTAVVDWLS